MQLNPALRKPKPSDLIAVPIDMIQKDEALAHPIYLNILGRPVLFRTPGDELTADRAVRLSAKTETVSIPRDALNEIVRKREAAAVFGTDENEIRGLLFAVSQEMDVKRTADEEHVRRLERLAGALATTLHRYPERSQGLVRRFADSELYYVAHSVNVAIYSIVMGSKLGLNLKALKTLALGALLHNIGNFYVPEHILFKTGPLTPEEWKLIQAHPARGAELLTRLNCPPEVVQMVEQHHERVDGKGYPLALKGTEIHLFSRICSIADVFDALTSNRPYRKAVTPLEAIEIMREMKGKFDPKILTSIVG